MNNTCTESQISISHLSAITPPTENAEPEMIYQLVKTPAVTFTGSAKHKNVYSILALEKCGENVKSNFIYDISRTDKTAHEILENIRAANPNFPAEDFISGIL